MSATPAPESASPVVVVADDEIHIVDVLSLLLEPLGVRVVKAYNGEQALRAVQAHRPHLVLTNVIMPKLGGAELCRRLKARPETAAIPVVLISSLPREELPSCQADGFLAKPFDLARVEEFVRGYLPP
jgi:CheY-like chemotaxis protein